jgi:tetratricopeptide (TPR) repeat protein/tRNA A-37 threonylcarbamoyl transferase component Bud32
MNEESLFREALSRSQEDRTVFLEQACAGRPELLAAVKELLAAHEKPRNILDRPPLTEGDEHDAAPGETHDSAASEWTPEPDEPAPRETTSDYQPEAAPGLVIAGRYELVERIGEGGMGEVWVAKQTEPVKRRVALKLIKAGMDSKAVLQRFEQERQALALMDYPNIAKVLDGGLTADRRPFFVMELVSGLPLTKFCDDAKLGVRERLELFVPICQAVQHAHQKGIIHRDLKPSNILVTIIDGRGVPKVIDFGVAKATSGRLTEESLSTQFGAVVGTLEYMSPEQAGFSGEDIDTRADIYSLGVILYELLTGLRPLDAKRLRKAALTEMVRIIKEEEPSKPSTRISVDDSAPSLAALRHTEPKKLAALLRGELDWVVMKCLDKQRDRRYETANGLARDIQRYLANELVEARPPTAGYRLRKFVRRNKGRVVAAGLFLLMLLAGIGAVVGVQAKANRELAAKNADLAASNERERQRFDLAMEAVGAFHTGASEDVLLKQPEFEPLRKKLLGGAAEFYRKLQAQLGDAADARSQAALARAYAGLGGAARSVGSTEQALTDYGRSRELYESLAAADPANPAPRRELVRVLFETWYVRSDRKELNEQRQVAARAAALAEELAAVPADPQDVSLSVRGLVMLAASSKSPDEQERVYARATDLGERLVANHPHIAEYHARLAAALRGLSLVGYARGKYEDCAQLSARAAQAYDEARRIDPADGGNRRSLAAAYETAGLALGRLGRFEEALAEFRRALQVLEELTAEQPAVIEYQQMKGNEHQNATWVLWLLGRTEEAGQSCRRQLAVLETLVARHPDRPDLRHSMALALLNTGIMLGKVGHEEEAVLSYQRAVDLLQALVKAYPNESDYRRTLGHALKSLGYARSTMGKSDEATVALERARDAFAAAVAEQPADVVARGELADSWRILGWHLGRSGRVADGLTALGRARELAERLASEQPTLPEHRIGLYQVYSDTGLVLLDSGDAAAAAAFQRAMAVAEQLANEYPKVVEYRQQVGRMLSRVGRSHQRAGRLAEARAALERCRDVWEQVTTESPKVPDYRDYLGRALANLGYLEALSGDPTTALPLHQKAVGIREKVVAEAPRNTDFQHGLGNSLTYLGQTYRRLGKQAEADQALDRALGLVEPLLKLKTNVAEVQEQQLATRLELGMLCLAEGHEKVAAVHLAQAFKAGAGRLMMSVDELVLLAGIHAQTSKLPDAVISPSLPPSRMFQRTQRRTPIRRWPC